MRIVAVLVLAGLACAGAACSTNPPPAPVSSTLRYPDFIRPPVPEEFARTSAAINHDLGWRYLQGGDLRSAERELKAAGLSSPSFYPADVALGYVALARKNSTDALVHFDRALATHPNYVSALVGRGHALAAADRDAEALVAYERAVAIDPSLTDLSRRVAVLRFRNIERTLAAAREAVKAGKPDEARRLYEAAIETSPESAVLYRELAVLERQQGDLAQALTHVRRALAIDGADTASHVLMADLLDARGELDEALKAYDAALALEASDIVEAKRDAVRAKRAVARLPAEYRAIDDATQVTRADLAALIGLRLGAILERARRVDPALVTDTRASWAEPWIAQVVTAGIMAPYENHTFQPKGLVRRVDLAEAVSRLLGRIATLTPGAGRQPWQNRRVQLADVAPSHIAYEAVSTAVASGVLTVGADTMFQPSRLVSGAEAVDAVRRLEGMARSVPPAPASRR